MSTLNLLSLFLSFSLFVSLLSLISFYNSISHLYLKIMCEGEREREKQRAPSEGSLNSRGGVVTQHTSLISLSHSSSSNTGCQIRLIWNGLALYCICWWRNLRRPCCVTSFCERASLTSADVMQLEVATALLGHSLSWLYSNEKPPVWEQSGPGNRGAGSELRRTLRSFAGLQARTQMLFPVIRSLKRPAAGVKKGLF